MTADRTPSADALIAVIGATGRQGGSVVDALLERGVRVRGLVRDPDAPAAGASPSAAWSCRPATWMTTPPSTGSSPGWMPPSR